MPFRPESTPTYASDCTQQRRNATARLVALLCVTASAASGQAIQLPKVPTCATCRVELTRVATLGAGEDGFVRSEPIWMARDSKGRIYVTWQNIGHGAELAAVYDSTGRFIQEIGRKGQGPGEFYYPVTVHADRSGRILIWDFDRRTTLLDANYRFVRQHTQRAGALLWLPDGSQVVGVSALDRDSVLAPITVLDSAGNQVSAFGATRIPVVDAAPWRTNRIVAAGANNTVWAARPDFYRVEQWSRAGSLARAFARSPDWFDKPVTSRRIGHFGDEPTPAPRAIREDAAGRLWYLASVASANWRNALGAPRAVAGRPTTYPQRSNSGVYDTMIDVIDTKTGTLLVSQRAEPFIQFFLSDELAASYRQEADGTPLIDIWRLRITTK